MFFAYALFGSAWAYICYKHLTELLPIQVRILVNKGISINLSHICYAVLSIRSDRLSCHRDGSKLGYVTTFTLEGDVCLRAGSIL